MAERRDKLGRRIPEFDRSAAAKKGIQTQKEKYGADWPSRIGTMGGRQRTRGHFGKLKAEGKTAEIQTLSKKAQVARKEAKAKRAAENDSGGQ